MSAWGHRRFGGFLRPRCGGNWNRRASTSGQCPKLSPDPHMPQRTDDLVPRILPVGDAAVLVEFGDSIDPAVNDRVYSFAESVTAADIEGVEELVPTYRSLLVQYDLHQSGV